MGHLLPIVFALVVVGVAEDGIDPLYGAPALVPLLLPIPRLIGFVALRLGLRGHFRTAAAFRSLLGSSGVLLFAVALLVLGWHETVTRHFATDAGRSGWPDLALALSLCPFLLLELCAIDARARLYDPHPKAIRSIRGFQARMFAANLSPLLLFGAVMWFVGRNERWRIQLEEIGWLNAVFTAVLLVAMLYVLPFFLRIAWSTKPLENGVQRSVLERIAERAGFQFRELLVWETGGTVANAAIVGFHRSHRVVMFTDALLARLPPRELAAVFGHEIGHARRGHVGFFAAWTLGFFAGLHLIAERVDSLGVSAMLIASVAALALGYFGFGFLSRRFELEADLESLAIVGDPGALASALLLVTSRGAEQKNSWRHFSVTRRVAFVGAVAQDPSVGTTLRRRLRRWAWTGVALAALALGGELHQLWRGYGEDRVLVSLRMGDYGEAVERAEGLAELSPGLTSIVERASDWGADPGAEALAKSAQAALARGRLETALRDLQLASLGGDYRSEPIAEVVRGVLAGEESSESALQLILAWRAVLEPSARSDEPSP